VTVESGTVGRYRILERIAAGGLGDVFRARDTTVGRTVALKVLPPELAGDQERCDALLARARAIAAVSHPNLAQLYDADQQGGDAYLAFEFVQGEPLNAVLGGRPLNVRRALDIAIQIADGLIAAHDRGIVHGDLKPANVLVAQTGRVKVLDVGLSAYTLGGLAREAAARGALDSPSPDPAVALTIPYMSPEQALGEPVDHRTDIFTLGTILFEMTTGRSPFAARSPGETILRILQRVPSAPGALVQTVPPSVDAIVARALSKSLAGRYGHMSAMRADLRSAAEDLDPGVPLPDTVETEGAGRGDGVRTRRRAGMVLIVLLVAAALSGVAGWYWWREAGELLRRLLTPAAPG
jgi:serine/threonine protein kinase